MQSETSLADHKFDVTACLIVRGDFGSSGNTLKVCATINTMIVVPEFCDVFVRHRMPHLSLHGSRVCDWPQSDETLTFGNQIGKLQQVSRVRDLKKDLLFVWSNAYLFKQRDVPANGFRKLISVDEMHHLSENGVSSHKLARKSGTSHLLQDRR